MNKKTWIVFFGILSFLAVFDRADAELDFRHQLKRTDTKLPTAKREEEEIESGFNLITWNMPQPSDGRRISLTGMPMPNQSPVTQADSDYYREDTYVDSFSLDVQHSVTDIHIPVGSDHLALEVRRTLTQEIWGEHGFGPDEHPDKPFGRCWLSNLAPSIHWYTDWVGGGYYYITDHTGQQYTFATFSTNYETPFPVGSSGQVAMDMMKTKLVKDSSSNKFTLTLPSGTKLYYAALPDPNINASLASAYGGRQVVRPAGGSNVLRYHLFARLEKVEDRHGNQLIYSGGMIPSTITAQPSGLSLTISQSGGRVNSITDPNGNVITYHYDGGTEGIDDDDLGATIRLDDESVDYFSGYEYGWPSGTVLSQVERELGATTTYQYWYLTEEDYRQYGYSSGGQYPDGMYENSSSFTPEDQYHLNIRSITDANSNKYSFGFSTSYDFNFATWSFQNHVHVSMLGVPRLLNSVSVPDNRGTVSLSRNAMGTMSKGSGQYYIQSHRTTTIYDLDGTRWQHAFLPAEDPLVSGVTNWFEWRQPNSRTTRSYAARKLEISNNKGYKEVINIDAIGIVDSTIPGHVDADPTVLALGSQEDQWGNETRYEYGQMTYNPYVGGTRVQPTDVSKTTKRYDAYNVDARYSYNNSSVKAYQPIYEYDELDRKTDYTYLSSTGKEGLLSQTTVAGSKTTRFLYENTTWPAFVTKRIQDQKSGDPSFVQRTIQYVPHAQGLVSQEIIDPSGLDITTTYGYDSNNNRIMAIDPVGNTNWFAYDALNRLVAITNADLTVRSFGYDPRGNKTAETNEIGNITFWQYDGFNRVTNEVVDLNGNGAIDVSDISTKTIYSDMGSVESVTDPNGMVTFNYYDHLQRLTNSIVDYGGLNYSTTYEYNTNSGSLLFEPYGFQPTRIVDARGYETKITYDKLYREVELRQQISGTIYDKNTKQYDDVGNLRFETRWKDGSTTQVTEIRYDSLNQPTKTKFADTTEIDYDYTSTGLLYRQWDELDRLATTHYDKAQRPWKVVQPTVSGGAPEIETGYDDAGNVISITDPEENITTFLYDSRNRKVHTIQPLVWDEESGQTLYPTNTTYYDGAGNVVGIRDARQNLTTNLYDAAYRLTNSILPEVAVYGGGTTQPYTKTTYDKNGNPRFVEDANQVVMEMQYDALNRLAKSIDGELHSIAYEYDASGNRTSIKDQNGNMTRFGYDGLNSNTNVAYADQSEESFGHDWLANKTSRIDANGVTTDYRYNSRNRLYEVEYDGGRKRNYTYDNVGNLKTVVESSNALANVSYNYDALNRVESETSVGVTHTYGYDLAGNRTDAIYGITQREIEWVYDPLNRTETITDTQGYTSTINVSGGGGALQTAINGASGGELILVADGIYTPVVINKPVTVQSVNGAAYANIQASSGRCASLTNNARLVGFTLTGGNITDGKGAGALVGKGCLIADCDIDGNSANGINANGGGLFLQTGATAQNCLIQNNTALNGGGVFCEKGGLVRNCTVENNTAESMGGGGVFMQDGGWMANSVVDGNVATNTFARGGGGVLFYNDGGRVNSSTIKGNTSVANGSIHGYHSTYVDPGKIGDVNHSILWNNTPVGSGSWQGAGNQTIDPATVSSAPGANLSVSSYNAYGSRATQLKYDLNGSPMLRELPNNVDEFRTYDALNRIVSNTNKQQTVVFSSVEYQYDPVGNLMQMDDTVSGLHTIPSSATWNWTYDDTYRLESETVQAFAEPTRKTEFDWDGAGNRTAMRKYEGGSLTETTTYKIASVLNQMLGWTSGVTNAIYTYDANGNRQDKFIIVDGTTKPTNYEYDEDNRLIKVTARDTEQPKVYSFEYDYRTRRIERISPTETTTHVFDGGLGVQEYDTSGSATLSVNSLTTESIRGEGMGGGVGGMVYSVRNGQIEVSHSNHRGDVFARTDNSGNLSWFARYCAYGNRFDEFGATYDRQRANTKDEEEDLTLLNEGERWRDLEHGVMLTPDPLGYYDGPNRYAYVQNNPITHFDARGLYLESFIEIGSIGLGFHSLVGNIKEGNVGSAFADAGGIVVDGLALAVPAVPGGVGIGLKAKRAKKLLDAIDTSSDSLKSADKVGDALNAAKTTGKEVAEKTAKETSEKAAKEVAGETAETVSQKATKEVPTKQKTKAKDRRAAEKKKSNKQKHGDENWEEPASEDYGKWKHKQKEQEAGKDARRKMHDKKQKGEPDRSASQLDKDFKDE